MSTAHQLLYDWSCKLRNLALGLVTSLWRPTTSALQRRRGRSVRSAPYRRGSRCWGGRGGSRRAASMTHAAKPPPSEHGGGDEATRPIAQRAGRRPTYSLGHGRPQGLERGEGLGGNKNESTSACGFGVRARFRVAMTVGRPAPVGAVGVCRRARSQVNTFGPQFSENLFMKQLVGPLVAQQSSKKE